MAPLHREPEQAAFDAERDRIVTSLGYVVVRIDEALVRGESRLPEEMISAAGMKARAAK
jgi:very-short-patch-repair endonuclease